MVEAMDKLVDIVRDGLIAFRLDLNTPATQFLIYQGFVEPLSNGLGTTDFSKDYKLTQRGVDEAKRYAEGKKAFIGEDQ